MHTVLALLSIYVLFLGIAEFFRKLRALWSWLFRKVQR
jgi:hypothetical protein